MKETLEQVCIASLAYLVKRKSPRFLRGVMLEIYPYDDNLSPLDKHDKSQKTSSALTILSKIHAIKWEATVEVLEGYPIAQNVYRGQVTLLGKIIDRAPTPLKYGLFSCLPYWKTVLSVLGALGTVTLIQKAFTGLNILGNYVHNAVAFVTGAIVLFLLHKILNKLF